MIWNFSAFIARSSLSIKTYLIQKKELQECRLTLLASYKSIIGINLFNQSTTISLKKRFFHIFFALELHLLFLIDFYCQTLHTVLTPGISTISLVLEMGSRQITHKPLLICRDSYKGNSTRTGVLANNTCHKPLGSDCLDSWHLCLPVGQLGFRNIHGYT